MSWIKTKPSTPAAPAARANSGRPSHQLHLDPQTEARIAQFLEAHGRLVVPAGRRPVMLMLGSCRQDDGSVDYSIRTRIRRQDGKEHRYDSHVRITNERLRLIR